MKRAAIAVALLTILAAPVSGYLIDSTESNVAAGIIAPVQDGDGTYLVGGSEASGIISVEYLGASAESDYVIDGVGIHHDFVLGRTAAHGSYGNARHHLNFSVREPSYYRAYGFVQAYDVDGKRVILSAQIRETVTNDLIFNSDQRSDSTPDELLQLGIPTGDLYANMDGWVIGPLDPNTLYQFWCYAAILNWPTAGPNGASAEGTCGLEIIPAPEPTQIAMVFPGALMLLGVAKRRTRRR
jgi:hypothetical protein